MAWRMSRKIWKDGASMNILIRGVVMPVASVGSFYDIFHGDTATSRGRANEIEFRENSSCIGP